MTRNQTRGAGEAQPCPRCNGEGFLTLWGHPRYDVTCGECQGQGMARPFLPEGGVEEEPADD